MKNTRVLIAGAGLGSVIAECALRLGFENICIIDGDRTEATNLNRQNYLQSDINRPKAEAINERLLFVNSNAKIQSHSIYLDEINMHHYIQNCDIAINTMDFDSNAPFDFDRECVRRKIPVIHPMNLGWAGCAFVITDKSTQLEELKINAEDRIELAIVEYLLKNLPENSNYEWLHQAALEYSEQYQHQSPPQLSVASWIVAGLTSSLLFEITNDHKVKLFPDCYFLSAKTHFN
jgi:molybdopterin/thiamine biosynthesis adenylyltransferase